LVRQGFVRACDLEGYKEIRSPAGVGREEVTAEVENEEALHALAEGLVRKTRRGGGGARAAGGGAGGGGGRGGAPGGGAGGGGGGGRGWSTWRDGSGLATGGGRRRSCSGTRATSGSAGRWASGSGAGRAWCGTCGRPSTRSRFTGWWKARTRSAPRPGRSGCC